MSQAISHESAPAGVKPSPAVDHLMRGIILGGGVLVLALLAWGHLGLGAWLFPPVPSALQQTARAGAYRVTLDAVSGQMTADGPNTITFTLHNAAGQPVAGASVRVELAMATMAMAAPTITAQPQGNGAYAAHPLFGMAGIWKVTVVIAQAGQPAQRATFQISVRWR
jgi:hypothetical protein